LITYRNPVSSSKTNVVRKTVMSRTLVFDSREEAEIYGDARSISEKIKIGKMIDDSMNKILNKLADEISK